MSTTSGHRGDCINGAHDLNNKESSVLIHILQKDFAIYVLDDYAVHLMPEVRKASLYSGS